MSRVTDELAAPRNQVVVRALRLLSVAAEHPGGLTAVELARKASVPRATGARLVTTLAEARFLERELGGGWVLGAEVQRLARLASPHAVLARRALPALSRLAETTGGSVTLSVPHALVAIDVILQVDAPRLLGTTNWIGRLAAPHASSAGKLMLAELTRTELEARFDGVPLQRIAAATITDLDALIRELERVRRQGYAESVDELEDGLVTLAAPVRAPSGRLAAMLGYNGPARRLSAAYREEFVPVLHDGARRLEVLLSEKTPG